MAHGRGGDIPFEIRTDGTGDSVLGGILGDLSRLTNAAVLARGVRTPDLATAGSVAASTKEVGDAVLEVVAEILGSL